MKVVAIITMRNSIEYLKNCVSHLNENEIEVVIIDHESTDGSYELCKEMVGHEVACLKEQEYHDVFSLERQLMRKKEVVDKIDADWVLHQDIDECLVSPYDGMNLREAIEYDDSRNYNVINFNELVFLPIKRGLPYYESEYYYYYSPCQPRLMRAWRKDGKVEPFMVGGHMIHGEVNLSPKYYSLLHYMFTSQDHAKQKYGERDFSKEEISKGWHKNRLGIPADKLMFPNENLLKKRKLNVFFEPDLTDPWDRHYWSL